MTRAEAVARRWASILGLALAGAAICWIALPFALPLCEHVFGQMPEIVVAGGALALVFVLRTGWGRYLAFLGLRHPLSFPSVWVAGGMGTGVLLHALSPGHGPLVGLIANEPEMLGSVGTTIVGSTLLLCVSASVLANVMAPDWRGAREPRLSESKVGPLDTFEALKAWTADDKPLTSAEFDHFSRRGIALRIARRLLQTEPPAQAVIGQLGVGKTSVRNMVEEALLSSGTRVVLVPVELWQYHTATAAVDGAIRQVVAALSQRVEITSVRGLPEEYVRAIDAMGGLWARLAKIAGALASPFDSLKKLDLIATAINTHFAIWVDDLERFAGDPTTPETAAEAEKLNPIRALLYGIDQLPSFSAVTVTTSFHARLDIEKIARFIEEIPELPGGRCEAILHTFRLGCRSAYDDIDPGDPEVRKVFDNFGDAAYSETMRLVGGGPGVTTAVADLARTPRALKQALRVTLDAWHRLHGEVDFDDLLAMSVLRSRSPDGFATIHAHLYDLRRRRDAKHGDEEEKPSEFSETLDKRVVDGNVRAAVREIVDFVFDEATAAGKPQGIRAPRYWARFFANEPVDAADADQPVLEAMLAPETERILELLEGPRRDVVENVARLLPTEFVVELLVPLVERRAKESPSDWADHRELFERRVPGLLPLWRMWLRRHEAGELRAEKVFAETVRAIDVALPKNLQLVAELEHHFVGTGEPGDMLYRRAASSTAELADDEAPIRLILDARKQTREKFLQRYAGDPGALVASLEGAIPYTLLWICWGLDRVRKQDYRGTPFEGWDTLAGTILVAAARTPEVMMPQVAALVVKEQMTMARGREYRIERERAVALFGDEEKLFAVVRSAPRGRWCEANIVAPLLAAAMLQSEEKT